MVFRKFQWSVLAILLAVSITQASAIELQNSISPRRSWYAEAEWFHAKTQDSLLSTLPFAHISLLVSQEPMITSQPFIQIGILVIDSRLVII